MRARIRRLVTVPAPVAIFFAGAGTLHLVRPEPWMAAVPDYLPAHRELVILSGVAEIVGGLMAAHPRTRRLSGPYLALLLLAVWPANLHMAMNPEQFARGLPGGAAVLWGRMPLQLVLIAWVLRVAGWRRADAARVPGVPGA